VITRGEISGWLKESDAGRLEKLWRMADTARSRSVGDEVHLRGLVEISNYCVRRCTYCGIRSGRGGLRRYRMGMDEILACARQAVEFGYGTIVLQSGEDPGLEAHWVEELTARIKSETPLAVTLCLGERSCEEYAAWRAAGADRYLLKFETSNAELFRRIHPPLHGEGNNRVAVLKRLRELGYEIGSGVMIGIPGQTFEDLANALVLFQRLELDMIGSGPYIPHPDTPLGTETAAHGAAAEQVPNDALTTCKVIALTRLLCPWANIPATTALATIDEVSGLEAGLGCGANVVMPGLTPPEYTGLYDIYPSRERDGRGAAENDAALKQRITAIGRRVGTGRGDASRCTNIRACCEGRMQ